MEQFLTWRKGLFDSNYQVYKQNQIQASLLFSSLRNDARGLALNKSYFFTTEGYLNPITKIRDENGQQIGLIHYDCWQLKATITLNDQQHASWAFSNSWLSKWTITDHVEKQITYQSSSAAGTIISNNDDELLLLSGLFIKEFYARILILFLITLFIPILIRGL